MLIGTAVHNWPGFYECRKRLADLKQRFYISNSCLTSPDEISPLKNEIWINNRANRFYPLLNLYHLLSSVRAIPEKLLVIESDIQLSAGDLERIERLDGDYYFLYQESDPEHPDAYERTLTTSCVLSQDTKLLFYEILSQMRPEELTAITICQPSFIINALGLECNNQVRLTHSTHPSNKPALSGILKKYNDAAADSEERLLQRSLALQLAEKVSPRVAQFKLEKAMERLRRSGKRRIGIYGAGKHTLAASELIREQKEIVAIIDNARAVENVEFCGHCVTSLDAALNELAVDAIVLSIGKQELQEISELRPAFERSIEMVSLYTSFSTYEQAQLLLIRNEFIGGNRRYLRAAILLLSKQGFEPDAIAEAFGVSRVYVETSVALFDRYGAKGLNPWIIG